MDLPLHVTPRSLSLSLSFSDKRSFLDTALFFISVHHSSFQASRARVDIQSFSLCTDLSLHPPPSNRFKTLAGKAKAKPAAQQQQPGNGKAAKGSAKRGKGAEGAKGDAPTTKKGKGKEPAAKRAKEAPATAEDLDEAMNRYRATSKEGLDTLLEEYKSVEAGDGNAAEDGAAAAGVADEE